MFHRVTIRVALLSAALALAACGGDDGLGECPPNSQNQQVSGSQIVFFTCIGCHSSQLEGAERQGAPVGTDYDQPDIIRRDAAAMYAEALARTMPLPPNEPLNDLQVENLRIFLACGAEVGQPQGQ